MNIVSLDHLVLTVRDINITIDFYCKILGMQAIQFGEGRHALGFGKQKINLHQAGKEFEPKAVKPTPGSADLCFITTTPLTDIIKELNTADIHIEEGPVKRTGATGALHSIYLRDPDGNLLELSNQIME